jgi:hypothetical protein
MKFIRTSVLLLFCFQMAFSGDKPLLVSPTPDSLMKTTQISLVAFTQAGISDTLILKPGDSVFVYDGNLYFRAMTGGREFFISREDILSHSDSLFIFQNLRLTSKMAAATSSDPRTTEKVERKRCSAITRDGGRCRRLALPGSDRCWQHKK